MAGAIPLPAAIEQSFPGRLLAGPGARARLGECVLNFGQRVLLVSGGSWLEGSGYLTEISAALSSLGIESARLAAFGEPRAADVDRVAAFAREWRADCLVGVGGGSAMDLAKAAAAMAPLTGSVEEYLEGVGTGKHPGASLPWIAMPTTAGTGSETTSNAVIKGIGPSGAPYKKSLRHPNFLPRAAILDPDFQEGAPSSVALPCAFDALSQLMEAASSRRANPITDAFAFEGIKLAARALDRLLAGIADAEDRQNLSLAAAFSGLSITGAGLGLVHGIAGNLGAMKDIPHGHACALLAYPAFRDSLAWLKARPSAASEAGLARFSRISAAFGLGTEPDAFVSALERWTQKAGLAGLAAFGFTAADAEVAAKAASSRDSYARLGPAEALVELKEIL